MKMMRMCRVCFAMAWEETGPFSATGSSPAVCHGLQRQEKRDKELGSKRNAAMGIFVFPPNMHTQEKHHHACACPKSQARKTRKAWTRKRTVRWSTRQYWKCIVPLCVPLGFALGVCASMKRREEEMQEILMQKKTIFLCFQ